MKNKVLETVGGLFGIAGFLCMVGVAGHSDLMSELGVYEPWYTGWQYLLLGLLLLAIGAVILAYSECVGGVVDEDF